VTAAAALEDGGGRDSFPRRAGRWAAAHPFAVSVIWALWLSALYGVFGPHSYVRIQDNADGFLAIRSGMNAFVGGAGWLTSWARSWASGVDKGVADLDALLFVALPGWLAYFLVMFGQRLLAAYFGFRLMRDRFGTRAPAAFFMALTYSAFFQHTIQFDWAGWTLFDGLTMAAIPLIAWLLLTPGISRRRLLTYAVCAGALYALTTMYAFSPFMILMLPVLIWLSGKGSRDAWLAFAVFWIAWLVVESPAVFVGYMNSAGSQRALFAGGTAIGHSLLDQLSVAGNVAYENGAAIALGLWAAFGAKDRRARWLMAGVAVTLIGVAFAPQGQELLARYGGPLAGFQFQRIFFWVPLLAVVAGALGVDAATSRGSRPVLRVVAAAGFAVVLVVSVLVNVRVVDQMMTGSNFAVVYDDPALVQLGRQSAVAAEPFRIASVATNTHKTLPVHPAFAWAQDVDTADGYLSLYPKAYHDLWERVIAPISTRDAAVAAYFGDWGNRLYLYTRGDEKSGVPLVAAEYWNLDLLALDNVRYIVSSVPLKDPRLREVSKPGIRPEAVMARREWVSQVLGAPIASRFYVYELSGALPRAFAVGAARTFPTQTALLDAMASANTTQLASTVFVEATAGPLPALDAAGGAKAGPLTIAGDSRSVDVRGSGASMLILTEQYSRFWSAHVDGARAAIVRVDEAFMGVAVPAGTHVVTFDYRPAYVPQALR
jgi:hypothetical protein